MKQHHGKFVAGLAFAASFAVAASSYAQAPAPAPTDTTAPPSMMSGPKPMGPDDMSGQVGFGAGVNAGTNELIKPGATINIKYWLSDTLAVMPQLALRLGKIKGSDMNWEFSPSVLALHHPWKTTSTRLSVGAGLGLSIRKWGAAGAFGYPGAPPADATIAIKIPIYAGVEHFFTKWFSMGIGVQNDFISYTKQGDGWGMSFGIDSANSTVACGFLFFYTD
jgi:hypothetical protein